MIRRANERGNTLFMSLIFLVLLSLFAASAFNSSTGGARIVSNTQVRQEAVAAAQKAIGDVVSSTAFSKQPALVGATPITVDINGDGATDYTVTVTPQPKCYRTTVIKSTTLDPSSASDLACVQSAVVQGSGVDSPDSAVTAGNSLCAMTEWNIRAQVNDPKSNTKATINQGVTVRALQTDAQSLCL